MEGGYIIVGILHGVTPKLVLLEERDERQIKLEIFSLCYGFHNA